METYRSSRVLRAIRRGNSWPVVAETPAGPFVIKLRGAAHGTAALVAEVIVAEIAEAIGLQVPARALIAFDAGLVSDDRNDELADLLAASHGINLGFQYLTHASDLRIADVPAIDESTASRIVWLDWLTMNPDRTGQNPNILVADGGLWLIDHGSALGFHHNWSRVTEQSPSRPIALDQHVLRSRATRLDETRDELGQLITREVLRDAVRMVPEDFLTTMGNAQGSLLTLAARREAYVAFLWKRLRTLGADPGSIWNTGASAASQS
jgi:hypothetical protein